MGTVTHNVIILFIKKYIQLLVAGIIATIAISLSSCGDDNDEPNVKEYDGTLYGEWISTSGYAAKDYIYFSSTRPGYGTKGNYDASIDLIENEEDITWYTVGDKTLYINGKGYDYWCDGSELQIKWKSNKTVTYREL